MPSNRRSLFASDGYRDGFAGKEDFQRVRIDPLYAWQVEVGKECYKQFIASTRDHDDSVRPSISKRLLAIGMIVREQVRECEQDVTCAADTLSVEEFLEQALEEEENANNPPLPLFNLLIRRAEEAQAKFGYA